MEELELLTDYLWFFMTQYYVPFVKPFCMEIDFGIGGIASKLCRALAACVKETYYMFCLSMLKPLCGQPTLEYGAFE
jgi:hypothetical protein